MEQISEKGIEFALQILTASGDLPKPTANPTETHIRLIAACKKYIETSKARADVRTKQEEKDCLLVYYFQVYLEDTISTVN